VANAECNNHWKDIGPVRIIRHQEEVPNLYPFMNADIPQHEIFHYLDPKKEMGRK
jgi:hypothetical protein